MDELKDLGAKFARDQTFCFDNISIHEIIFDESHDLTLYCTVPYFGETYFANFGLSFDQLNILLRAHKDAEPAIAAALAEKLDGDIEIPSIIEVEALYGKPFEINNCVIYTSLYDISDDDEEEEDETDPALGDAETGDEDTPEDGYEAFAFIVDEIKMKPLQAPKH